MSLGWGGFGLRFLFAIVLVFATYNPSGYSYYTWVRQTLPEINPYIALVGILLVIGWVVYIRATFRSLGFFGLLLISAVCACVLWMLFDWGVLNIDKRDNIVWLILSLEALVLSIGMSWSFVRRRISGQTDVDDVDED